MPESSSATKKRVPAPAPFLRHAFLAILGLWILIPLALQSEVAQDAIPYLTAGELVAEQPNEVYAAQNGDLFDLRPIFRDQWCMLAPAGTDCDNLAVAFVSTPPVLPATWILANLGGQVGSFVMRLAASLMLAGGMWQLWRRLAHRTTHGAQYLVTSALLLTPMAMVPIGLGQTSPVLFLSVCLGLSTRSNRRKLGIAAAWAAATLIKLFPGALVILLISRRRWKLLGLAGACAAIPTIFSIGLAPLGVWSDFVRTTLDLSESLTTNPYNGSLSALLETILPGLQTSGGGAGAIRIICLAGGAAVCWFGMRNVDDDTRWAVGWVALLLVTPLVWWHYTWVAIGALAIVLSKQRRLNDQVMAILPVVAAVSIGPSIPNARGWSMPELQALFLIGVVIVMLVLIERTRRSEAASDTSQAAR